MSSKMKVAVFVSGGGTNLQKLIEEKQRGGLPYCSFELVVASNSKAYALERAKAAGINAVTVAKKDYSDINSYNKAILKVLEQHGIEIIVTAGYLSILGKEIISKYENKIINIHPSLIPGFCGMGYYGLKVHEQVLEQGVKVTGATVHFVNEGVDTGAIILQRAVKVLDNDTPITLQKRVMKQAEWVILPMALDLLTQDKLVFKNKRVVIRK